LLRLPDKNHKLFLASETAPEQLFEKIDYYLTCIRISKDRATSLRGIFKDEELDNYVNAHKEFAKERMLEALETYLVEKEGERPED